MKNVFIYCYFEILSKYDRGIVQFNNFIFNHVGEKRTNMIAYKFYPKKIAIGIIVFLCVVLTTACGNKRLPEDDALRRFTVYINYERVLIGYNEDVIIFIDGEEIGSISAGDDVLIEMALPGPNHEIFVKQNGFIRKIGTSNIVEFSIDKEDGPFMFKFNLKEDPIVGLELKLD